MDTFGTPHASDFPVSPPVRSVDMPRVPEGHACVCGRCGGAFAKAEVLSYRGQYLCAACKQDYFQHFAQGTLAEGATVRYGFMKRALAKWIDVNMALNVHFLIQYMAKLFGVESGAVQILSMAFVVGGYTMGMIYSTVRYGGTPGKLVFRLAVADADGHRPRYGLATARFAAELVSVATFGMGYVLSLTDPGRRTLHDRICQTRIVPLNGGQP